MRTRRSPRYGGTVLQFGKGAILAALTVGGLSGCTREFFREWANQDVSEAIFEKSRDPRWRLDAFSIEPPALSRHADPYDQDAPPAPPDDIPAEALSPVPQWPSNRLIVPVEGTGYLDLLEYWQRNDYPPLDRARPAVPTHPAIVGLPPNLGVGGVPPSLSTDPASRPPVPFKPHAGMANPFAPGTVYEGGAPESEEAGNRLAEPIPTNIIPDNAGGTGGTGTAPGTGRPSGARGGSPGSPSTTPSRVSPGSPTGPSSVSPGSPSTTPPRVSPGSPGAPIPGQGQPRTSADVRPPDLTQVTKPAVQIIRLQNDQDATDPRTGGAKISIPPPRKMNSGTKSAGSTPISVSKRTSETGRPVIPPPRPLSSLIAAQTVGARGVNDRSVARVTLQENAGRPDMTRPAGSPAATIQPPGPAGSPAATIQPPATTPGGFGSGIEPPDGTQGAPRPGGRVGSIRTSRHSRPCPASPRSTARSSMRRAR